jgi:hypothetical protein
MSDVVLGQRQLAIVVLGGMAIAIGAWLGTSQSGVLSTESLVALGGVLILTVFLVVLGHRMT